MQPLYHRMVYFFLFFFFNDTATTEIYTLSLHDALPISRLDSASQPEVENSPRNSEIITSTAPPVVIQKLKLFRNGKDRSEEHTSELQSRLHLVCRLLLEKKNNTISSLLIIDTS